MTTLHTIPADLAGLISRLPLCRIEEGRGCGPDFAVTLANRLDDLAEANLAGNGAEGWGLFVECYATTAQKEWRYFWDGYAKGVEPALIAAFCREQAATLRETASLLCSQRAGTDPAHLRQQIEGR